MLLGAEEGNSREGSFEIELDLSAILGKTVEFRFVSLHMFDKVDEVAGLLELLQVFGVDRVSKLILNADDQLDGVKRVKTVVFEMRIKLKAGLHRRAEVVLSN